MPSPGEDFCGALAPLVGFGPLLITALEQAGCELIAEAGERPEGAVSLEVPGCWGSGYPVIWSRAVDATIRLR
jgi:hypothetical protein